MNPNPADHLPLARWCARRFVGRGIPFADLVQTAALAMCRAVRRFDPERGAWSTLATHAALQALSRAVRQWRPMRSLRGPEPSAVASGTTADIRELLASLPYADAALVASAYGVCGRPRMTRQQLADDAGLTHQGITHRLKTIFRRVRERSAGVV